MNDSEPFWSVDLDDLFNRLKTTPQGLSQVSAESRLPGEERRRSRRHSRWSLLANQFKSPIILLLIGSAVLSFLLGDVTNAWIIVFILIASGFLGFWQELSAADAVAKLLGMIETRATVLRDGVEKEIPLSDVVPGDVILLRAGDLIPGDSRLMSSRDLHLNESALTGESFPAEKSVSVLPAETPLARRGNSLYLGTSVVSGIGSAVVVAVGKDTEFGRISQRLEHHAPETGFERGLRQFGELLIKVVGVITVAVLLVKVGWQHRSVIESLQVGLALAVGMTPQLLPAITSVVLASGAKAMAGQQVIVKQLLAIENLGSMTVLCSDKTGTLTKGVISLHAALDVNGHSSDFVLNEARINAALQTGFVNPIDQALCDADGEFKPQSEKQDEIPYDFIRKRLSILVSDSGGTRMITKGALSNVLGCCSRVRLTEHDAIDLARELPQIESRFAELSACGFRVLGVATKSIEVKKISLDDERDMTFLGFLVFTDPPKEDAAVTLRQLSELGIRLKVITGDNRAVAKAVSECVGFDKPIVVTGADLGNRTDSGLRQDILKADVFAEIEPNQKEQIVLALKDAGEVVGYLGDGINDASALHSADVGISVASAVDVAREAAQVVLLKQDLAVLVAGVREGRKTFANTLKYVFFAIAANFGYMFSLAVASLVLPFEPLLASQILLVNLLADFPAMALATDNVDQEQVLRPRQWDVDVVTRFMLTFGLTSSLFDFLTFGAILFTFGASQVELFRTGWFVESTLTGLMILLVIRTQRPFFLSCPGSLFLWTTIMVALITIAVPYTWLATLLGFVTPPPLLLGLAIGITLLYGAGMEFVKQLFNRTVASRGARKRVSRTVD